MQSNTASAGSALGGILVDDASTVVLRDGSVNLNTPGNCSFVDPVCAIWVAIDDRTDRCRLTGSVRARGPKRLPGWYQTNRR